jgi:hypothetical protein
MTHNREPKGLGAPLGALIAIALAAIALAFFLLSGGDKKTVHGDNQVRIGTINALAEDAWTGIVPPAQVLGREVLLKGKRQNAYAYGAVSKPLRLPKGAMVAAAGRVEKGGLSLGLLDSADRWAVTTGNVPIARGPFRVAVEAPSDGVYRIVLANNLPDGETEIDARVAEVGLIDLDPATAGANRR